MSHPTESDDCREHMAFMVQVMQQLAQQQKCPDCGSYNTHYQHRHATFAVPECGYMICEECDHQWWHE